MENLKETIYKLYITEGLPQRIISEQLNLRRKQVEYWIKKWGFIRNDNVKIDSFKISLEVPEFCYFLGLWIADGWINKKKNVIGLALKDETILRTIANFLNPNIIVRTYNKKNVIGNVYQMHIAKDNELIQFLSNLGLDKSDKTFTARFPLVTNPICAKMLLRGYIDGDGNIRDGFRVFTASESLKDDLVKFMKVNYKYDITVSNAKRGFTLSTKREFYPTLISIYQDYEEFSIPRKRNYLKNKVYDIVHSHKMINYGSWGITP